MSTNTLHIAGDPHQDESLNPPVGLYRLVLDSLKEVVFKTDANRIVNYLSAAWTEITGFTTDEMLGKDWVMLLHPDDRCRGVNKCTAFIACEDEVYHEEMRVLCKDESFRWMDIKVRLFRAPDGTVLGTIGTLNDVTERRQADDALRAAKARAEQALADLEATQRELIVKEKMASLGILTAGIAHEIKNPLNFVTNFSDLSVEMLGELSEMLGPAVASLDSATQDEATEMLAILKANLTKVRDHGRRADSIVKTMLAHSRDGTGERVPTAINVLVDEALNLAYHGARAHDRDFNVDLERELDPSAGEVEIEPHGIMRVCLNLFANGFYATRERSRNEADQGFRPTLKVTTKNLGDRVQIHVRDNGIGIPPAVVEKIFTPFFTTKPPGEGSGLGLSLSYDIAVQQHGGTLTVQSEEGSFTEICVSLPRRVSRTAAQEHG